MDVYLNCKQKLRLPWYTLRATSNWYSWQIACLGKHTVSLAPWSKVTFPHYGFSKSFFQGKGFGSSNSLKEVCSTIGFHTLLVTIGIEILHRILLKTPYRVLFSRDVRQSDKLKLLRCIWLTIWSLEFGRPRSRLCNLRITTRLDACCRKAVKNKHKKNIAGQ